MLRKYNERADVFEQLFLQLVRAAPKLKIAVFVLDSSAKDHSGAVEFWEYRCDIVIRLDHTHPESPDSGYYLRTIEIVKARYQKHAWGPHQLKIYEAYDSRKDREETPKAHRERLRRAHPFRDEGGIFVYPSIHYLLSTYKRSDPDSQPSWVPTPICSLTRMLPAPGTEDAGGGFPEGRCTAFLGARGGHKSHLGLMHILDRVLKANECAVIVSLRDDVGLTMATMRGIIAGWDAADRGKWEGNFAQGADWPSDLSDRLEIMYFPPGNITPEEFVHRILLSVLRLRGNGRKVTCLFNSLDQLGPRFPLCAKEQLFMAALLQVLCAEQVTSLVVAASEHMEATHYYGLESIAELILSFNYEKLPKSARDRLVSVLGDGSSETRSAGGSRQAAAKEWLAEATTRDFVTLKVVRQAGGQAGGARAVLELVNDRHPLRKTFGPGLYCFPL